MTLLVKIRTALSLGLYNLWRVFYYRLSLYLGFSPVSKISASIPSGEFFRMPAQAGHTDLAVNGQWQNRHFYFGWYIYDTADIPKWHTNPFNGKSVEACNLAWWLIPDFNPGLGDIKAVWEASRFDWLMGFSQRACQGDELSIRNINAWIKDWVRHNPPYFGPNWKCGQEASIRVMHLSMAAVILGQIQDPEPALIELVRAHLIRITPTIGYAIAQDNNHGTSEAAALFIGGSWLNLIGECDGKKWQKLGRKWLENRARRLIEEDGSFSQYSVSYHRVMLDTFSMVEIWRRKLGLTAFSQRLYSRLSQSASWLYHFTQPENGDVPNLGANDGARLLPLTETDYRDFRPSVQLAMALFKNLRAWSGEGSWNLPLHWLGLPVPDKTAEPQVSQQYDQGGYYLLRKGNAFVLLNYPRFRFRPSQADLLHIDFWLGSDNLLRDGGTYSYHASDEVICYFGGTESHNTIQFDDREQMPRLSRFLLGDWLNAGKVLPIISTIEQTQCSAGYTDSQGASHHRTVVLAGQSLKVIDRISGFRHKAVLRWRLQNGEWRIQGSTATSGNHQIKITSNVPISKFELTQGYESRYYLRKEPLPVIEVEVNKAAKIISEYTWLTSS